MNLNHFRGWEVEMSSGKIIREGQMEWNEVPKKDIIRLTLRYDGRQWDLTGNKIYYQKKHASVNPNIANSFRIESRSIGYYENDSKVLYTVDEHTGRMKLEVINIK